MSDPSFLQCLSQHSQHHSVDIVSIVATCYGFVGRPRSQIPYLRISQENYPFFSQIWEEI